MRGAAGLFTHTNFLPSDWLRTITPLLEAAPGELAAIQPVAGGGLSANEEVRRAWEIELADDLHEDLVSRIHAVHSEVEQPGGQKARHDQGKGAWYARREETQAEDEPQRHEPHQQRRPTDVVE